MGDSSFVNLYDILGIDPQATPEQIRAAVKDKRKIWVLRQNAPSLERRQEAETMLAGVAEAERVLLKSDLRVLFNQQLRDHNQPPRAERSYSPPAPGPNSYDPPPPRPPPYSYRPPPTGPTPYSAGSQFEQATNSRQPLAGSFHPDNAGWRYGGGYQVPAVNHPAGGRILFYGIAGLFCVIMAPVAWVAGDRALRGIRASGAHPANEKQIVIGRMLGIILTVLTAAWMVIQFIVLIAM